jgi:hypothetical protein
MRSSPAMMQRYTHWLIRLSQADPGITLSVPLPTFPSYPSNPATHR